MANFNPQQLTDKGRELLARAFSEEKAIFWSKVSIGNGEFTGDISTIEELVSSKLDAKLIDSNNLGTVAEVVARFSNEAMAEEFEVLELGLFGKLQGDTEEVLYSYSAAKDRSIFPDMSVPCEIEQTIYTQLENGDAIEVYIDPQLQYLTREVADVLYEPVIQKKTGFNKEKTSSVTEGDSEKLFTGEGAKTLNDKINNLFVATEVWSGSVTSGNITLAEAYTNFNLLEINTSSKESKLIRTETLANNAYISIWGGTLNNFDPSGDSRYALDGYLRATVTDSLSLAITNTRSGPNSNPSITSIKGIVRK